MCKTVSYRDFIIIGAGIYGLYAAYLLGKKGLSVTIVEFDHAPFQRASYINQARVHQGYHYPRSFSTAKTSAVYFNRFSKDYKAAINKSFKKIYAISNRNSYTSHRQFLKFCRTCEIPVLETDPATYFNRGTVAGAYETEEYAFDAGILRNILLEQNKSYPNIDMQFEKHIVKAENDNEFYYLNLSDGIKVKTRGIINATYASINQLQSLFGFEQLKIKYEICEIILVDVNEKLKKLGITIMDGPFFSTMPFGQGIHSLTSVEFTPHKTCYHSLPDFSCQQINKDCTPLKLQNCNLCKAAPETAYVYMNQLAKKYLRPEYEMRYKNSLFAVKPILMASELDDSRPTAIRMYSNSPVFMSVLSGKINTIYEMERYIDEL